jgi:hypothetical protein
MTDSERLAAVEALLHEVLDNHLPHLNKKIDNLKSWIMGALLAVCLSLVTVVANLLIQLL